MADENNYFSMNALRALSGETDNDELLMNQLAKEQRNKTAFYRDLLGNDVFANGIAQYGEKPFFKMLDAKFGGNPAFTAKLMGSSGEFMPMQNGMGPMTSKGQFMPRVGVEGTSDDGRYRAGATMPVMQMPDGSYKSMPKTFDVGYNTPMLGGELDVGAAVTPRDQMMKEAMYNLQARYNRRF